MNGDTVPIRVEHLGPDEGPPLSAFGRALRTGEGSAASFLPPLPQELSEWSELLASAAEAAPRMDAGLVEALVLRQEELGAGSKAAANAHALGEEGSLCVVTGQQPGLVGGPLLTFHKAAGAIALARKLDGLDGHRVVPVFWLASEDHDFDEANSAVVVDRSSQVRALRLDMAGDGRSLMDLPVGEDLSADVLEQLRASLPDTERGALAADLAGRRAGEPFPTWCVRILAEIFGDSGLVIVEPPVLAPWMGPPLADLLDNAEVIRNAVHETGQAMHDAGLPAPLWPQEPGATALFYREEPGTRRLRVSLDGEDGVRLREEPAHLSRAELREQFLTEPLHGSGNVIGRVFVQNQLLPVLAYVAGPTEIAYHAQVRAAHEALGRFFPLAVPRPVASWVDGKARRLLEAFEVPLGDVLAGRAAAPVSRDEALDEALAAMTCHLEEPPPALQALLEAGGRGAEAGERVLGRLRATWEKSQNSIRSAVEADAGVGRARWERLQADLRPRGKPQGRVLSPLSLIARYGVAPIRAGLLSLDPLPAVHHVVHLGEEPRI